MTAQGSRRSRTHRPPSSWLAIVGVLAVCLSVAPWANQAQAAQTVSGQGSAEPAPASDWGALAGPPVGATRVAGDPVLDSRVSEVLTTTGDRGAAAGIEHALAVGLDVHGGKVRLVVEASNPALARGGIKANGIEIEASSGDLVQVLVAPGKLDALRRSPGVGRVRPPFPHTEEAVAGQGVATIRADAWHAAGISGAGVKVAIVDLGFAGLGAAQAAGDLPGSVLTVDYCSGKFATATEHGTAVAEIVHEIAPSAQLHLICIDTEVQLAQALAYAKANGIDVINHSVGWFNSSRGDGTGGPGSPDAIATDASGSGILWVNAAGNAAQTHWSGTFTDDGSGYHLFAPGNTGNGFYVGSGETACAFLKWDDWPVSNQDYDLYLVDAAANVVAYSWNDQDGTVDPTEAACYKNVGTPAVFYVVIDNYGATEAVDFDLFVAGVSEIQYPVATRSVTEPASAPAVFAAGAVCWAGTTVEPYSSQGPTIAGRIKPDLSAPDQVSSSTYGAFTSCGAFGGFTGTSAAAPHVAGAAALVKSANPGYTLAQLKDYLGEATIDLGPVGIDPLFGTGLLRLPDVSVVTVTLESSPDPSLVGASVTLTATLAPADATGTVTFRDTTGGGSVDVGSAAVGAGVATITTSFGVIGVRDLVAEYSGDGAHPAAVSATHEHRVRSASLIATTTSVGVAPNPATTGTAVTFTATVAPNPASGSVTWTLDGVIAETTAVGPDGTSTTTRTYPGPGRHLVQARFTEGTVFDESTSATREVVVTPATTVSLQASRTMAVSGETLVTLTAIMGDQDAYGSITFRDTLGGSTTSLGTVTLVENPDSSDLVATLSLRLTGPGVHSIAAEYGGGASYPAAVSSPVTITVSADFGVAASGVGVNYATFYPYKDGYRDTVALRGTPAEPLSVVIRVYNSSGRLVRSWSLATRTTAWAIAWNGRTASGTLLAAGKYKVVQKMRDVPGHVKTLTSYTTLSNKRLYTYTKVLKKTTSRLARNGGSWYGWTFALPSATVYKKVVFAVYGRSGSPRGLFGPHDYTSCPSTTSWDWYSCMAPYGTFPSGAAWKSVTGSVTRNRHGNTVRMYAVGGYRTYVRYARVTVTYALLK